MRIASTTRPVAKAEMLDGSTTAAGWPAGTCMLSGPFLSTEYGEFARLSTSSSQIRTEELTGGRIHSSQTEEPAGCPVHPMRHYELGKPIGCKRSDIDRWRPAGDEVGDDLAGHRRRSHADMAVAG